MSELRSAPGRATSPGIRPLTPTEYTQLDRLRSHLRESRVDLHDTRAVGALLHAMRTRWAAQAGAPVLDGLVAAFGVGIGDLVIAAAPGARWALRTAGTVTSPAVVSDDGLAAVLPVDDVRALWKGGCEPDWVVGYVGAAAEHLLAPHPVPRTTGHAPATPVDANPAPTPLATGRRAATPGSPPPVRRRDTLPTRQPAPDGPDGLPHPRRADAPEVDRPQSPADLPSPPSARAQDLALRALEHSLDAVLAGECPLVTVAMTFDGTHRTIKTFPGDPVDGEPRARAWVRDSAAMCAVVAWDGAVDGARAVVVEASDRGRPSMVLGHRYAPAGDRDRPREVGRLVILGQSAPLL